MNGHLFTFARAAATPSDFVAYWSATYSYGEEHRYTDNIRGPHTPESLRELFAWKVGKRFEASHMPAIEKHFISRMDEANRICVDVTAEQFLDAFRSGGTIYRIYWAHCWQPERFPIYDQHVHRAMAFIRDGRSDELDKYGESKKASLYVKEYLPFHTRFAGIDSRDVDRALWAFGKFIKRPPIPIK